MKAIRWAAVTVTVLMSLLNLPGAFDSELTTPHWATRLATGIGVAGLVAAFGLARRLPWGRPLVLATGVVNLAGAITALAAGWEGDGRIGIALSLLILGFGWFSQPAPAPEPAYR
jgi:hypothetical protein